MERWVRKKKVKRFLDSGYEFVMAGNEKVTRFKGDKEDFFMSKPEPEPEEVKEPEPEE